MTDEAPEETIGNRLGQARLAAGYKTQMALAEVLGINKTTYNAHEKRPGGVPNSWAIKYAKILDCDLAWLLTGEGDMRPGEDSNRILRLSPSVPATAQQAIQTLISHIQHEPTSVVTMAEVTLLREAVDLFNRLYSDQRPQDCMQAQSAIARLEAFHETQNSIF
mgnify:CR=1 FL=1